MKNPTTHEEQLALLKKIEGQVRGVQKMIEEGRYCVDIVIQLHSIVNAIYGVSEKIFAKHIEHCVANAFEKGGPGDRQQKMEEVVKVMKMLHKLH